MLLRINDRMLQTADGDDACGVWRDFDLAAAIFV